MIDNDNEITYKKQNMTVQQRLCTLELNTLTVHAYDICQEFIHDSGQWFGGYLW